MRVNKSDVVMTLNGGVALYRLNYSYQNMLD